MILKLKEDPKEWRKAGLFGALGLSVTASLLRWRHVLTQRAWLVALAVLAVLAICALARPRWFRGWYRVAGWLAFQISRAVGLVAFAIAFVIVITPAGLMLRLMNRDPLRLKLDKKAASYWDKAREITPLDRLF